MTKNRGWCIISGVLLLGSLGLAQWPNSPYWLILSAAIGLDLLQSGFTDWGFVAWLTDRASGIEPPRKRT